MRQNQVMISKKVRKELSASLQCRVGLLMVRMPQVVKLRFLQKFWVGNTEFLYNIIQLFFLSFKSKSRFFYDTSCPHYYLFNKKWHVYQLRFAIPAPVSSTHKSPVIFIIQIFKTPCSTESNENAFTFPSPIDHNRILFMYFKFEKDLSSQKNFKIWLNRN